jgi:glutathione S-transferase
MTSQVILHHFEASPFSEKIRLIFGLKKIAWQSVLIPRIMPKPELMPLTGGYRRTPVLQIGADIFCDTQVIVRELEARFPTPSLCPAGHAGMPWMVGMWTDRAFFASTVLLVFGSLGDKVPQDFIADRTKLRGTPFDVAAMTAALPHHRAQFRGNMDLLEAELGARPWLLGDAVSLADVNAYMNLWYVRSNLADADALFAEFPRLRDWESRLKAAGHGARTDISGADAIAIAHAAKPATPVAPDPRDPSGHKPGDRVAVIADEPVRTAVEGEIVALSAQHIAIRRKDARAGEVVVHFPRSGYVVERR